MTDSPAMLLWTDAYLGDTKHLSTVEHGAYLLILMAMWRAGGSLPNDEKRLARTAGLPLDKWRKIARTILSFMTINGATITQKRLMLEFKIQSCRIEKSRAAGKASARSKVLKKLDQAPTDVDPELRPRTNSKSTIPEPEPIEELSGDSSLAEASPPPRTRATKKHPANEIAAALRCLSPETAQAVIEHRRAKRCPLTVRAAQLLAKGFTATGDPNAAADMMIERGWQGFKPEWFDNERAGNGQARRAKGSIVEAGRKLTERLVAERLDRERAGVRGDDGDPSVRFLPTFGGQRS